MSKPVEIEVFRADTRASRGITAENIAEVASSFSGSMPICFGHPKSDTPAAGTVSKLRAAGSSLFATIGELTSKAVEGIKDGAWRAPSMAFFDPQHEANPTPGKWAGRHLALLGAAAPGIPGLEIPKSLAFSADDTLEMVGPPADAVVFAAAPTPIHYVFEAKEPRMAEKTQAELDAEFAARETVTAEREKAQTDRETAFAARVKSQFEATNAATVDSLVRQGKVLPAEADGLKLAFNALDPEGEELTFGAGDKASKATAVAHLFAFMAGLPKRVPLGGRESPTGEPGPREFKNAAEFNAAAEALAKSEGLTFEAAAERLAGDDD
jgi:hypothetical protein